MNVTLHGRVLWLGWLGFGACAAVALWIATTELVRIVSGDGVLVGTLTIASLPAALAGSPVSPSAYLALMGTSYVLENLAFFGAAGVLAWRRPNDLIALLVALYLVSAQATVFPPQIFAILPTDPLRGWLEIAIVLIWLTSFAWLFYLFPNGRFTPRWTIVFAAAWLLEGLYSLSQYLTFGVDSQEADLIATGMVAVTAFVAQAYRYWRVSDTLQQQQTKWFVGGLGVAFMGFVGGDAIARANNLMVDGGPPERIALPWLLQTVIISLSGVCAPLALVIALLRYRLFDIDLLIHRALVWGGLSAIVVGIYVLIVGALGALFQTDNVVFSLLATGCAAVVFQPLRLRLQQAATRLVYGERDEPYAAISRLGQRLEATLAPADILPVIVETVAGALRLPYVAIAVNAHGGPSLEATTGRPPVAEPLRMPLSYQGQPVGELRLAPRTPGATFSSADRRLLDDLARQAGVAARAVHLGDEARRLANDLQASREQLVLAREEERRRLRRDLHDGLGPRLAGLTLRLETAHDLLAHDPQAEEALADMTTRMAEAVADVRRIVYDLRPPSLDELGLGGAIRQAAESYAPHPTAISVDLPDVLTGLPAAVEVAAYRIVTEALTNVIRHASARVCQVQLRLERGSLAIVVEDDGRGISAAAAPGVGLQSMRQRAAELGGTFSAAAAPGGGTRVEALLPSHD